MNRIVKCFGVYIKSENMKAKFLMVLLASGIGIASCSSSKQTTTGTDSTVINGTDTSGMGTKDTSGTRTGDTIRTDTIKQ